MKVAIFFALVATAYAGNLGLAPAVGYGVGIAAAPAAVIAAPARAIVNTGNSVSQRAQDGYGNYRFAYAENGATGGTTRQEAGNAYGGVVGSYSLAVGDGRRRVVNYVADAAGFRANVRTNEPGTAPSAPAHAPTNVAVGVAPVAKVIAAPAVAAPVVAAAAPVVAAAPAIAYGAAPAIAYGAAPVAAYGSSVAHVAAAPALSYAAPVAHAKVLAAPAYAGRVIGGYGLAAPAW